MKDLLAYLAPPAVGTVRVNDEIVVTAEILTAYPGMRWIPRPVKK
jgi:hypothetical protein